jgi:hypothetical protein
MPVGRTRLLVSCRRELRWVYPSKRKNQMTNMTFAKRCTLSEQCLPDAPYRAMLTKLHGEMLQEIERLNAEVLEQCRINGMSAEREDALRAEVERLNKALTWEQNRAGRIGTHGPGCHTWGASHYECLLRVNAELVEALMVGRHMIVEDGTPIGWSVDRLSEVISKATGETK